jgi:hypothetical protein
MKENYLTVAGRIRYELRELETVVARTKRIWREAPAAADDVYVDATALNLHSFYAGLERVFELIADNIDKTKPTGAAWHQELLRQMAAEIPGVRPAVLSSEARNKLDHFRGFRHVVRNVYTFHLDPEQIGQLVAQLTPLMERITEELISFADFLEQIANDQA